MYKIRYVITNPQRSRGPQSGRGINGETIVFKHGRKSTEILANVVYKESDKFPNEFRSNVAEQTAFKL